MALRKFVPSGKAPSVGTRPLNFSIKMPERNRFGDSEGGVLAEPERDVDIDLREVYFLIMHFLSSGPCLRTCGQLWNELLEHQLLPRRYHAWYSRSGICSGDENDDGLSFPLNYNMLAMRYSHIEKDHLTKLLKELVLSTAPPSRGLNGGNAPNAADVPTLVGKGSFSLLSRDRDEIIDKTRKPPSYMRWPHIKADQFHGLRLREIGGGFSRHHRAPSIRASCYAIAKPSTMVQKMQNIKRLRGHRNAVYCASFDRSGRYVITGSDDRLVKIWSMEIAYCLASCRGHEGDITDLAVSSNNAVVASSSNDCIIRVWRLPDGQPISILKGHTGAVTAIAFSPRPGFVFQLLSSSDDGTCRIWDARNSQIRPRVYAPRPLEAAAGRNNGPSSGAGAQNHQIFCCAFNSSGIVFVTGSSDTLARVWSAHKSGPDDSDQLNHEIDVLSGHENDVNYVQFSSCAIASRFVAADTSKEENVPKFKNSWFTHDNIVTCSRDGSAIIWIPRSRRSQAKACRWTRAYHLKVPPPPMPPQPLRGGPRQRILPTPRGVNMIIWSLDNRFVLAAIMDCRICVWNASDGSLVHSLTGHTESTYVLDVHPFNPRIAMSAGYDGRTIVWDIWEGMPIQIYEISRFKLVDGKFSPDGTSIILSDDVGQLYILSTGQGESQKDAKYDQFFLGDYRPLIQDTYGNVLDQETQIPAFRRNMQDLLCDSGMIPYPEPYQSAYQKRRLGALGVEWNPSSLTLAIGPDFTLDPDFQMLPLADLDLLTEPLPELPDAMDWEPVIEIHSDDNDSEYNVPEEYLSGAEQGSLSSSSSDDSKGSEEDGETEDSIRRSKRKKKKADAEIMTSSGRRVKRRNFDETEGNQLRNNCRKSTSGRKKSTRKKKSSKSESLRPQRAAARNALNLFSKITETTTSTDEEDEEGSEVETSDSDSNIESDGSDEEVQDELRKNLKGKEVSVDESEDLVKPELHMSGGNRERLVLRLPNKYIVRERDLFKCDYRDDSVGTSSKVPRELTENRELEEVQVDKVSHLCLTQGYTDGKISWGGVRARSTKRLRLGEGTAHNAFSRTNSCFKGHFEKANNNLTDNSKTKRDSPSELTGLQTQTHKLDMNEEAVTEGITTCDGMHSRANGVHLVSSEPEISESTSKSRVDEDETRFISTKLRLKRTSGHPDSDCEEQETDSSSGNLENQKRNHSHDVPPSTKEEEEDMISKVDINKENGSLMESDIQRDERTSVVKDPVEPHCDSKNRRFAAVYRRTRPHKGTSNAGKQNPSVDSREGSVDGLCSSKDDVVNNVNPDQGVDSEKKLRNTPVSKSPLPNEEWGSSSKVTVGLRSTRSRRGSYLVREPSPVDLRRSRKSSRKATWLMLSNHEEGSRYIPQLGDEVAYLRQGHQEYLEQNRGRETPPWTSVRGKVRDVEYCKVQKLDYSSLPGSGESCCKMTLEFLDPTSAVHLQSFKMTLPEMTGFPDFLVERSRYDASMQRNWTFRDKCKVWWKNDGEDDGSWWLGRIVAVKPKSADFPDSPWERYTVQYKSEPTETHFHSPWELFDVGALWEHRHIDNESKVNLQSAFEKLEKSSRPPQDRYGVNQLKQLSQKSNYNNRFPVPISLELIESRLENEYYRSLEAVKHDYEVMLSNAEHYLGNKPDFSAKLKRLTEWLKKTFSPS